MERVVDVAAVDEAIDSQMGQMDLAIVTYQSFRPHYSNNAVSPSAVSPVSPSDSGVRSASAA